jgi:MFS family permease
MLSPVFLGAEAIGAGSLFLFARHSARAPSPFISSRLLVGKGFGVLNLINFLYGSAVLGFGALVPLYAEERYHVSTLGAGSLLTARAVGMIAVAGAAVFLLRRTGYRWPMTLGFGLAAVGLIAMGLRPISLSPYTWLAIAAALTGVGMGMALPASNNASLQLAPDQTASVAGLRGMFRQSGAITAVSVTTAILARSANPALAQAHIFLIFAAVLVLTTPLVLLVPEHRGSW